jgi:hypothetical protein
MTYSFFINDPWFAHLIILANKNYNMLCLRDLNYVLQAARVDFLSF